MFKIKSGEFELVSATCPKRAGRNGRPHLAVVLAHKRDGDFLVPACVDGMSATVNGFEVWDFDANDWAQLVNTESDLEPWEVSAIAAQPTEGDTLEEATALLEGARSESDSLTAQVASLTEQLETVTAERDAATARVTELEAELAEYEDLDDEEDPDEDEDLDDDESDDEDEDE